MRRKALNQTPRPNNHCFVAQNRLRHRREFQAVFDNRNSSGGALVVVYGKPNGLACNRLGLSIGRRYGNAVRRNRWKRLCRESFRLTQGDQPAGWDWVVIPSQRPGATTAELSLAALQQELLAQMRRIARRVDRPRNEGKRPP
jgi:ribonuclease P protein component